MIGRLLLAAALVASGAMAMFFYQRATGPHPARLEQAQGPAPAPIAAAPARPGDQVLILSDEARARAAIQTSPVMAGTAPSQTRWPGVVEPDGYRSVDITPIVGGTVLDVRVALGDEVRRGSVVARLRSPELTDEVRRWLGLRADNDVAARRLTRTRGLAKIGASSQQELEEVEAGAVRASTELDTARIRLSRLGITADALVTIAAGNLLPETIDVVASAGGVVVRREVNVGQNIEAATPIVSIADPSRVWVLADVFERGLSAVRVGQVVTVTAEAFAGRTWTGTVAYIDPQIARETRTVRVRIELDNPGGLLRFGMFVTVLAAGPADAGLTVPRAAVQTIGAASVVYVEEAAGRYRERPVVTGAAIGEAVLILAGLAPGERVVTAGSFLLRAERDRLGWPAPVPHPPLEAVSAASASPPRVQRVTVEITAQGFSPDRITVPANAPVDLVFVRRAADTCATEVLIPDLGVRRPVPLNEAVVIRLPARAPGELLFTCGMKMLRGVLVIAVGGTADH